VVVMMMMLLSAMVVVCPSRGMATSTTLKRLPISLYAVLTMSDLI
jgi:hypothetical protein